jgi:hypothetical protein
MRAFVFTAIMIAPTIFAQVIWTCGVIAVLPFVAVILWSTNEDTGDFWKFTRNFISFPAGMFLNGLQAARGKPPIYDVV